MIPGWLEKAACAGMPVDAADELFFPAASTPGAWDAARAICATCSVRQDCLAAAATHGATDGMWGGLTPAERAAAGINIRGNRPRPGFTSGCGSYARWHAGCRCEECVAAKRAYNRKQMRRLKLGPLAEPPASPVDRRRP